MPLFARFPRMTAYLPCKTSVLQIAEALPSIPRTWQNLAFSFWWRASNLACMVEALTTQHLLCNLQLVLLLHLSDTPCVRAEEPWAS
jgi:hypothetical protein